mgnify:CR=1 FL=1
MNKNVRQFYQMYIEPNKQYIIDRKEVLNINVPENIPFYIKRRAEDLKTMYLLGMDSTLMKLIPNFIEDILININISVEVRYSEELSKTYKRFERLDGGDILKNLYEKGILNDSDFSFCKRYYGVKYFENGGENIRNNEIHNKEFTRFSKEKLFLQDEYGNNIQEADEVLRKMIEANPVFFRSLNDNSRGQNIHFEISGLFNLLVNNLAWLIKLMNLESKEQLELYNSMAKSRKFNIYFDKDEHDLKLLETQLKSLEFIEEFKIFQEVEFLRILLNTFEELNSHEVMLLLSNQDIVGYSRLELLTE